MGKSFPLKIMKSLRHPKLLFAVILLVAGVIVAVVWTDRHRAASQPVFTESRETQKSVEPLPARQQEAGTTAQISTQPQGGAGVAPQFDSFRLRPFAVAKSTGAHEWTSEDARSPEAIRNLAHNEVEVARLLAENDRIKRRQLVYRKETVPMLLDRARVTGQPLRTFTLPGLDGKEVEVEVTGLNVASTYQAGSVMGRVKGRFDSVVSVGFSNGCESFNITSPTDQLFLTADAREPGEVLVKEIDPDVYTRPPGQTPDFILTQDPPPGQTPKPQSR